jgi:adenylosuccinate synthase
MMLRTKSPVLENIVRSLLNAIDVVPTMQSAQENNMKIIVEGANASMLDLDVGSYSYVTSSTTSVAGIIGALHLNPVASLK